MNRMKTVTLVNRHDRRMKLSGVRQDTLKVSAEFMNFRWLSLWKGELIWRPMCLIADDWEILDERKDLEPEKFRMWLRKEIASRGYTPTGVSRSLGFSPNWLWNILAGKRRLPERRYALLEQALGLKSGAIGLKRARCLL